VLIKQGNTISRVEQDGIHGGDEGGHNMIKCSTFGKRRKTKTKPYGREKCKFANLFC
jgi:hypothetical protein